MKIIKKRLFAWAFAITALVGISSCEDGFDKSGFETNSSVAITSFGLNGVEATIDQATGAITATLPYGYDVSAVVPDLAIPDGASINPALGTPLDFSQPVFFRVTNGNLYKDYVVNIKVEKPILSFKINDIAATINHVNHTISLTMPEESDLTALTPIIELSSGVSISPQSGTAIDFSGPVTFTVTAGSETISYVANVSTPFAGVSVAFLGTAASAAGITNMDESTAYAWLTANFAGATYISFADVSSGMDLSNFDVIWWHHDADKILPMAALTGNVITSLTNYKNNGGNLLLTSFASLYVETLGVVPTGKGPNNVFGDFPPAGFVDNSNSWGMSFVGHETHPIFAGLETFENGKAKLLQSGTFRLNHTAWWFLPEWGGYGNGQGWRNQTGGTNLASEEWDNALDGRVTIAEWPGTGTDKNVMVISMGAYDWYNEADASGNPSQANAFIGNIRLLTQNSINYLANN